MIIMESTAKAALGSRVVATDQWVLSQTRY